MFPNQIRVVARVMVVSLPMIAGCIAVGPVAHAEALSDGCAAANSPEYDGLYASGAAGNGAAFFHAGEVVVAQASEPTSFGTPTEIAMRVSDDPPAFEVVVVDTDGFPGTVTYAIPADGTYLVNWTSFDANVTWTVNCTAPPPPADEDGDSVPDSADVCPGTVPDTPTEGLRGARFALTGTTFDSGLDQFDGMYTIFDTGGCSGAQIVELMGLGVGHLKFGISKSALEAFIASL